MEISGLYSFVLTVILIGMILGVGILVLDKFAESSGVTGTAETALNSTRDAISPIGTTWLPLIVTVSILAIILGIVIRSFQFQQR